MTGPGAIPSIALVSNDALYEAACAGDFDDPAKPGTVLDKVDVLDAYTDAVLDNTGVRSFGALKLVIDCANGMGGHILPMLCKKVGNDPVRLYWRLDGSFPNHEANPLKTETMLALQDRVVDEQADLGVAFDGDGDRVAFTDENGKIIPGDFITALIAREMLKKKPGAEILYDLRSSWVVPEEIEKAGGIAIECRVGHGLIKKQMREEGGYFAGELSSHYYFSDFYTTDNGDLAMLNIIKLMLHEGKKMSEIVAPLHRYFHSGEINSEVKDIPAVLARLKAKYGPLAKRITEIDGYKAEFDDWWFNVRPSNTEPLIRLNLEAKTKEKMDEKVAELLKEIRS
jgi:phosphomannomutase